MSAAAESTTLCDRDRILVVEDDANLRELLRTDLQERGLSVRTAGRAEQARALLATWEPHVVISDLRLPDASGIELLGAARQSSGPVQPAFVVITAFGSIDQAVDALKKGADEFLTKPLDLDHLRIRVDRLLDVQRLRRDVRRYRQREEHDFHGIVGQSRVMRSLFDDITKVAAGRGAVLIVGESGTGKELVARAIHRESPRRNRPFVPVNCASIPAALMESEFFGHEPGAFTGATRARAGLFVEAHQGTILLDEVGELPLDMQAKLLRVLQDGQVRRVGSDRATHADVRVLVATNRDLEQEVSAGRFREDLYYRLATFVLRIPPLRERAGDFRRVAAHLLERFCRDHDKPIEGFAENALELLEQHRFAGNVRELSSAIEHAVTYCQSARITTEHLPERIRGERPRAPAVVRMPADAAPQCHDAQTTQQPSWLPAGGTLHTLDEVALFYVCHVLALADGNKRRAAALLGITRRTLYRYLRRLENPEGKLSPSTPPAGDSEGG